MVSYIKAAIHTESHVVGAGRYHFVDVVCKITGYGTFGIISF